MSAVLASLDTPQHAEVAEQLERILADVRFVSSERSSSFLRYVVERTLAGRASEIKELVIAVELYARTTGYDPKADSTVRVEASRVRARLQDYYTHKGAFDPIRIAIPKGAYVPTFDRNHAVPVAEPASEPVATKADRPGRDRQMRGLAAQWSILVMAAASLVLAWWLWRPDRVGAEPGPGTAAVHADARAESLTAWHEGNELLRQDPHSALSDRGMPQTLARAIERYELAVSRSPAFARGWASLAEAYEYAYAFVGRSAADDARRAEDAARRALTLDPNLAEGHAMLAMVLFYLRWDFAAADAAYRRALELAPRNAWAIVEYADLLRETGRLEQAAAAIRRGRALQPALQILAVKEAEILLDQGRPDQAMAVARDAIALKHDSIRAHVALGMALEAKGDVEPALTQYRKALEIHGQDRRALPALGYLLGRSGREGEARDVLRRLEDLHTRIRNCAFQIAVVHAGLGDQARALDWLEHAHASRQMHLPFMVVEPRFRSLRSHPRFQAIARNIGLTGSELGTWATGRLGD